MNPYVCADCGHEQDQMFKPCEKCHGPRIVAVSFCESVFGPNWRKAFEPPDSPNALKQEDLPPGVKLS